MDANNNLLSEQLKSMEDMLNEQSVEAQAQEYRPATIGVSSGAGDNGFVGVSGSAESMGMAGIVVGLGAGMGAGSGEYSDIDGIEESLNNMFAAVIVGGVNKADTGKVQRKAEVYKKSVNIFLSRFMDNIFKNEYAFLFDVIATLKVKVFSWKQLETLIENNIDEILGSPLIDLSQYATTISGGAATDEEKMLAFKEDVKLKFFMLSEREVTFEQFESSCSLYVSSYKDKFMFETAQNMVMIMQNGLSERVGRGRSKFYKGCDGAKEYYNKRVAIINALEEQNYIRSTKVDETWLDSEYAKDNGAESDVLIGTGIEEIDAIHGKLHRGNMIEFLGPPKGGKTTLATWLVERCLAHGLNVAIWPLEGEKDEWTALIQSLMVRMSRDAMYIDKKRIYERDYHTDEERQAVLNARHALATDVNRGRLSFLEGVCYVENMVDVLENHYNSVNAFDVIVVDSPILALSLQGKSRVDRVAEAYTVLKNFVSNKMRRKALCIVTAQIKQAVVDQLRKDPKMDIDVTAGGESAETIRTPDFVIGIMSTKEERNLGQIRIHDVAVRHGATFDTSYIGAELGCGYFYSDPALNNR